MTGTKTVIGGSLVQLSVASVLEKIFLILIV